MKDFLAAFGSDAYLVSVLGLIVVVLCIKSAFICSKDDDK